jgi:hypothetical protein
MGSAAIGFRIRRFSALCAVAALGLLGGTADAERVQEGNLIVSLNGGISPVDLPRDRAVPVAVFLEGGVDTTDQAPLPRVNRLKLELGWRGELLTRGLPVCPQIRLRGVTTIQARERCGGAQVGRGKLKAKIFLPDQEPFLVFAHLLAFNGRTKVGRRAVLVHVYTKDPPTAFVIPFVVHRQEGAFQTVLVTTLRRSVGTWPHVASFKVDVARTFHKDGKRRSYLNARCPVPSHFTAGFLSFARATYTFAGGKQLATETVRSCRAR